MTPWLQVAVQATQIGIAFDSLGAKDINTDSGCYRATRFSFFDVGFSHYNFHLRNDFLVPIDFDMLFHLYLILEFFIFLQSFISMIFSLVNGVLFDPYDCVLFLWFL